MSQPCIEIALIPIGGRTIEDESTPDGQAWTAIRKNLIEVPGFGGLHGAGKSTHWILSYS